MKQNVPAKESGALGAIQYCVKIIDEKKGDETLVLDLRGVNSYFDFFIITTGNSHVHCRSIARALVKNLSLENIAVYNTPDYNSDWIIFDCGEIIIHIFTQEMREFYQLEKLWSDGARIEISGLGKNEICE